MRANALALVSALAATGGAWAQATYVATPETYQRLIPLLRPGDGLTLTQGEYREGLPIHQMVGEPNRPITISGPAQGPPATFIARPGHTTVSIVDSGYLVIRNLVLEGGNVPVDAVKAEGHAHWAHHITLENLLIRGHGNNQQTVGISTKCPAWNWIIRGNIILGAGTGIYLGNSDGNAPFVAGLVERNLIVDTIGYNLQIKHQLPRPAIPGMPTGRSTTILRYNVFAKPDSGTPDAPRPNVLVGHFPLEGAGADDQYVVYGNFFYQNRYESLFQGEGNVAFYSNLLVNEHGDAIRIQPHNDIPRRIDIAFNTVLARNGGISVVQKEGAPTYRHSITANAVFAGIPVVGGEQSRNFTAPLADARRRLQRPFAPLGQMDLFPRARWATVGSASLPNPYDFPDWQNDFNRRPRKRGLIGGYDESGTNTGWLPRLERMRE